MSDKNVKKVLSSKFIAYNKIENASLFKDTVEYIDGTVGVIYVVSTVRSGIIISKNYSNFPSLAGFEFLVEIAEYEHN